MKIFCFSTAYYPNVGGVERITDLLCRSFSEAGHEVCLATSTLGEDLKPLVYTVIRRPSIAQFISRLRWCDIHMQASVSLKYLLPALFAYRKAVFQHNGRYRRDDGLLTTIGAAKVLIANSMPGIAVSRYLAEEVGCEYIVPNAYDDRLFTCSIDFLDRPKDLVFLGRLVSQKGCDVLLVALGDLRRRGLAPSLTVIGDGPDREYLQDIARREGISEQVQFVGTLEGSQLVAALNRHKAIVVPSIYEEPFGISALEGLAAGCVPIVSEKGGLLEAVGRHGLSFPNGNPSALAAAIVLVIQNPVAAEDYLRGREAHLREHTAHAVANRYIKVFLDILGRRTS